MRQQGEILSAVEIKRLTDGAATVDEQARVLALQRIPFKRVGRSLIVSRYHLRSWLEGAEVRETRGAVLELVR